MHKELMEQAINNCFLRHKYGNPGMEEGMCAGLRTMRGEGEPWHFCKDCKLQYQNEEMNDNIAAVLEENKWVHFKEQTPKEAGDYWVTIRRLDGTVTTEKYMWEPSYWGEQAWSEVVIAWQPYYCPKPFSSITIQDQN